MQTDSLYDFLWRRFSQHPDFSTKPGSGAQSKSFFVLLGNSRIVFLNVQAATPLELFFWTSRDLHKLRELPGLEQSPFGRMFEMPGKPYNLNYERTVGIDPSLVDPDALFDELRCIASKSSIQKLVAQPNDHPIKSRLKEYYLAEGEWEHEYTMEKLVETIEDGDLDLAISFIPEIDPWIEEDTSYALGTALILLDDLVRVHARCIPEAVSHLKRLRAEFVSIGARAAPDLQEVDALLDHIRKQLH
ncbi:MAG: hypothetical protein ABNH53_14440 [Henriciella sp.]|jgi:hypothetical protein